MEPTCSPVGPAFAIRGPIRRKDLPGLCDRVCVVLTAHAGSVLSCDVSTVPADAVTIEALALLQLAARRKGCRIGLRAATPELLGLVGFLGLSDVLPEETVSRPTGAAD